MPEENTQINKDADAISILVRNGGAKRLRAIMKKFHLPNAKDVLGLSLELLELLDEDADFIIRKADGTESYFSIKSSIHDQEKK